jgi:hypothetical protein
MIKTRDFKNPKNQSQDQTKGYVNMTNKRKIIISGAYLSVPHSKRVSFNK